jgi:small redox-active disulfide protein 2
MANSIKILGTGCPKCLSLEKLTREVVSESKMDAEVSKVDDIVKIMQYGIMRTPGIVVNEKVILSGRIPGRDELRELLQKNLSQ